MKIITNPKELTDELCLAIEKYKIVRFAVAWASANHRVFQLLKKNKNKILQSTVGLNFEQTHPDFIKAFIKDHGKVKFLEKKNGIFHPKIYFFYNNENDWKMFIGSANFTKSALSHNDEIVAVYKSNEKAKHESIIQILDDYFVRASLISEEELEDYKRKRNESQKNKTNNSHKTKNQNKQIKGMSWEEYYKAVKNDGHDLLERLDILKKAKEYFKLSFEELSELQRKNIGGVKKVGDNIQNWFLFGRMPSQLFANRLSDHDEKGENGLKKSYMKISNALEFIPISGPVTKKQFDDCISYFKSHRGWGYKVSTVSRLLAMKRPDQFFCITGLGEKNGNFHNFQEYFETPKKIDTFDDYWSFVIENVRSQSWFNGPQPVDPAQLEIWNARVALMDALFYET